MHVRVQFTTQLRAALGESDQLVELPDGATLRELLEMLSKQHAAAFQQFVWDDHQHLLPNLILTVGDQQVASIETQTLRDGDSVMLVSAISGG